MDINRLESITTFEELEEFQKEYRSIYKEGHITLDEYMKNRELIFIVSTRLVAKRIRHLRKQAGLTQRELANISKLSLATIVSLESVNGNHSTKSYDKVRSAFGIYMYELFQD